MSVRLCICASVRRCITAKKCCNFWLVWMICSKFSGPTKILASNFWPGDLDHEALGDRPGPQKVGFMPNISPPTVLGQGGRVIPLWNWEDEAKNVGRGILIFCPRPKKMRPECGAGLGGNQNYGISAFVTKATLSKTIRLSLFLCSFLIWRTPKAPKVPPGPGVWKSKVKIRLIFEKIPLLP